jgi:hypothetical protein
VGSGRGFFEAPLATFRVLSVPISLSAASAGSNRSHVHWAAQNIACYQFPSAYQQHQLDRTVHMYTGPLKISHVISSHQLISSISWIEPFTCTWRCRRSVVDRHEPVVVHSKYVQAEHPQDRLCETMCIKGVHTRIPRQFINNSEICAGRVDRKSQTLSQTFHFPSFVRPFTEHT